MFSKFTIWQIWSSLFYRLEYYMCPYCHTCSYVFMCVSYLYHAYTSQVSQISAIHFFAILRLQTATSKEDMQWCYWKIEGYIKLGEYTAYIGAWHQHSPEPQRSVDTGICEIPRIPRLSSRWHTWNRFHKCSKTNHWNSSCLHLQKVNY